MIASGARPITISRFEPSASIVPIPGEPQSSRLPPLGKCEKAIPAGPQAGKALQAVVVIRSGEEPSSFVTYRSNWSPQMPWSVADGRARSTSCSPSGETSKP